MEGRQSVRRRVVEGQVCSHFFRPLEHLDQTHPIFHRMHGQGSFAWPTGEKFDGEWVDGLQDGLGHFQDQEGCQDDGMWSGGRRHGVVLTRPLPPPLPPRLERLATLGRSMSRRVGGSKRVPASGGGVLSSFRIAEEEPEHMEGVPALRPDLVAPSGVPRMSPRHLDTAPAEADRTTPNEALGRDAALLRRYNRGVIVREEGVPRNPADGIMSTLRSG